jgi:hypothetical protein
MSWLPVILATDVRSLDHLTLSLPPASPLPLRNCLLAALAPDTSVHQVCTKFLDLLELNGNHHAIKTQSTLFMYLPDFAAIGSYWTILLVPSLSSTSFRYAAAQLGTHSSSQHFSRTFSFCPKGCEHAAFYPIQQDGNETFLHLYRGLSSDTYLMQNLHFRFEPSKSEFLQLYSAEMTMKIAHELSKSFGLGVMPLSRFPPLPWRPLREATVTPASLHAPSFCVFFCTSCAAQGNTTKNVPNQQICTYRLSVQIHFNMASLAGDRSRLAPMTFITSCVATVSGHAPPPFGSSVKLYVAAPWAYLPCLLSSADTMVRVTARADSPFVVSTFNREQLFGRTHKARFATATPFKFMHESRERVCMPCHSSSLSGTVMPSLSSSPSSYTVNSESGLFSLGHARSPCSPESSSVPFQSCWSCQNPSVSSILTSLHHCPSSYSVFSVVSSQHVVRHDLFLKPLLSSVPNRLPYSLSFQRSMDWATPLTLAPGWRPNSPNLARETPAACTSKSRHQLSDIGHSMRRSGAAASDGAMFACSSASIDRLYSTPMCRTWVQQQVFYSAS